MKAKRVRRVYVDNGMERPLRKLGWDEIWGNAGENGFMTVRWLTLYIHRGESRIFEVLFQAEWWLSYFDYLWLWLTLVPAIMVLMVHSYLPVEVILPICVASFISGFYAFYFVGQRGAWFKRTNWWFNICRFEQKVIPWMWRLWWWVFIFLYGTGVYYMGLFFEVWK